jgi:hypothetical protein
MKDEVHLMTIELLELLLTQLRALGNVGGLFGFFVLTNVDKKYGICIGLICSLLVIPSYVFIGLWDSAIINTVYSLIRIYTLYHDAHEEHHHFHKMVHN